MKLRKIAAAAAAAAIAASAFSVQGFAAGKKMELLTAPLSEIDGATDLLSMSFENFYSYGNDDALIGFISITDENIDSWRESGEFSYNEVKADGIDLSNKDVTIFTDSPQIAYRDENGNFTKRLAYSFNGTDEMALTHESDEWFFTRNDGYSISRNINEDGYLSDVIVTAPDSTQNTAHLDVESWFFGIIQDELSEKYVAYCISQGETTYKVDPEYTRYTEDGDYAVSETIISLIDKKGEITELCVDSVVSMTTLNDGVIWYIKDGAFYEWCGIKIDFDKAELVTVPTVMFGKQVPTLDVYGDVAIAKIYEGYFLHNLKSGFSEEKEFYQDMSTGDNGKKFLVQTQDGKWGYLNSKGKLLATFDGAGWFIGDYAPVVENGKAYLIDRSMNRVSEKIDAEGVCTLGANLFRVTIDGEYYLMTYVPDESADEEPIDDNTDVDVEEPDDNTDVEEPDDNTDVILDESTDSESTPAESADAGENTDNTDAADTAVENPNTGAGSIAAIGAVLISAAGALVLSRKHR